jgi:hypothetical protein
MPVRSSIKIACACIVLILSITLYLNYPSTGYAQSSNTAVHHYSTQLFIGGPYTLQAAEIDGENAHLQLLPDLLYPILTFSSATIYEMNLSHPLTSATSVVITSPGPVSSIQVAIKTSTWQDLKVSLGNISPVDLLTLTTGGTVKHLVLTNVNMNIDVYLTAQNLSIPGCQIQVAGT